MSFIPNDIYKLGKPTFKITEKCNFLSGNQNLLLPTTYGLEPTFTDQHFVFLNSETSNTSYVGGFDTAAFKMQDGSSVLIYNAELILEGLIYDGLYTVKFTDGTNQITFQSANQTFNTSTTFDALINGTTSTGTVATSFNMCGDYNTCRSTTGAITRENITFRIDKNRGEISLWVNDQIEGCTSISGLENFGESHFELRFSGTTQSGRTTKIKQIGLNLEC